MFAKMEAREGPMIEELAEEFDAQALARANAALNRVTARLDERLAVPKRNIGLQCRGGGSNSSMTPQLDLHTARTDPLLRRPASCAMRTFTALFMLIPALAVGGAVAQSASVGDFYITLTSNDLYLCGEGFGGLYGCIDEAISREAKSVVISASSDASVYAIQELISAVHAVGFEQVGVATFQDSDN